MNSKAIESAYQHAREVYGNLGVDVDKAMATLSQIALSMHCWQGDDVVGFENIDALSGGGIQTTGNYPGKARTGDELRADLDKAMSLIPGKHRLNLHSIYAETNGKKVERNELAVEHYQNWIEWAKAKQIGMDFNGTFFAHPKADSGFTLSHYDDGIRKFWVEHGLACRKIGEAMGKALGTPCVTNIWIPDGYKDIPVDRLKPRELLKDSLDTMLTEKLDKSCLLDSVECKLFGIGSESYVVGSHEFYMGYAVQNNTLLTLDSGHFHPTETVADKISSMLLYVPEILLHVSRGVRWDSDHVVVLSDDLYALMQELVRGNALNRVHIGLDYFDASINRIAAWVIGMRASLKALLQVMLEPTDMLRKLEVAGDYTSRLALLEEMKSLPMCGVWDYYCMKADVPVGQAWLSDVKTYEKDILSKRG